MCWEEMLATSALRYDHPEFYRGINCQRFLAEAFRTRRSAIEPISVQIEDHIITCLRGSDIIRAKLAAESIGLLSQTGLEQAIALAVSRGDFWVRDTAIDACRFLPELPPSVRGSIWRLLVITNRKTFIADYARLKFSFGLSPSLREVSDLIDKRAEDIQRWNWTWPMAIVLAPMTAYGAIFARFAGQFFRFSGISETSDSGQMQLSKISSKLLNAEHIDSSDLIDLGLVGAGEFRAAFFKYWRLNILFGGLVGFVSLTVVLPEWFKVPNDFLFRAFGFNYLGWLQMLEPSNSSRLHLTLLLSVGWIVLGGLGARYLASLRFPLFVSGEPIENTRTGQFGRDIVFLVLFPAWMLVVVLIFHSAGYVIHSAWLMQPANYSDPENFYYGTGFLVAASGLMLARGMKTALMSIRDRHRLKKARSAPAYSREQLFLVFSSFEKADYREKYVDFLTKEGVRPVGEWPDGSAPNLGDVASTKLARLEHDWRGLNK
jgi:hypothetical protein